MARKDALAYVRKHHMNNCWTKQGKSPANSLTIVRENKKEELTSPEQLLDKIKKKNYAHFFVESSDGSLTRSRGAESFSRKSQREDNAQTEDLSRTIK